VKLVARFNGEAMTSDSGSRVHKGPLAGKSTLNSLELNVEAGDGKLDRYNNVSYRHEAIDELRPRGTRPVDWLLQQQTHGLFNIGF